MNIKQIETVYKGYKFRSRLEARWAVFFDACGARWEYEPEGYDMGQIKYLPDFLLHGVKYQGNDIDLYVEVKGVLTEIDKKKIEMFSTENKIIGVNAILDGFNFNDLFHSVAEFWKGLKKEERPYFYSTKYVDNSLFPTIFVIVKGGGIGL